MVTNLSERENYLVHVLYEIEMFYEVCRYNQKNLDNRMIYEAFLLHFRLLFDFFNNIKSKMNEEDDLVISDFLTDIDKFTYKDEQLQEIKQHTNKCLAHLTKQRANIYEGRPPLNSKLVFDYIDSASKAFILDIRNDGYSYSTKITENIIWQKLIA